MHTNFADLRLCVQKNISRKGAESQREFEVV